MPIESADPQRSLGDYVAGDPLADVELPERSVEWRAEPVTTPEGLQILSFDGRFEYPDGYLGSNVAGFVIGDVDEYLAEYGGDELSIPPSYTNFDKFDPHITQVSCSGSGYGFGITADRLEAGVRFATGGGRYSVDELTASVCENNHFIVRTPAGAFAIAQEAVRGKPEGFEPDEKSVAGMNVPEHNETMLSGIERLCAELENHASITVNEHVQRRSSSHEFATANGETFTVSAAVLREIQHANAEKEVLDHHEYETMWGEAFEYEPRPSDLSERVGEETFNGVCIGHRINWSDPRIGARYGTDRPLQFEITSYRLSLPEDEDSRVRICDSTRRVAEFETDGDGTEDPTIRKPARS